MRLARRILEAVELRAVQPQMGAQVDGPATMPAYRRFPVGSHVLFYRVMGDKVFIVRVWDARQSPDTLTLPGEEPNNP